MKLLCGVRTRVYFWIYLKQARRAAHTAAQNTSSKLVKWLDTTKLALVN